MLGARAGGMAGAGAGGAVPAGRAWGKLSGVRVMPSARRLYLLGPAQHVALGPGDAHLQDPFLFLQDKHSESASPSIRAGEAGPQTPPSDREQLRTGVQGRAGAGPIQRSLSFQTPAHLPSAAHHCSPTCLCAWQGPAPPSQSQACCRRSRWETGAARIWKSESLSWEPGSRLRSPSCDWTSLSSLPLSGDRVPASPSARLSEAAGPGPGGAGRPSGSSPGSRSHYLGVASSRHLPPSRQETLLQP